MRRCILHVSNTGRWYATQIAQNGAKAQTAQTVKWTDEDSKQLKYLSNMLHNHAVPLCKKYAILYFHVPATFLAVVSVMDSDIRDIVGTIPMFNIGAVLCWMGPFSDFILNQAMDEARKDSKMQDIVEQIDRLEKKNTYRQEEREYYIKRKD